MTATDSNTHHLTQLLGKAGAGDEEARDKLMRAVYSDLKRIAHRELMRGPTGETYETTDLVNEAYLRLFNQKTVTWTNRMHFFALSARIMRGILIDYARMKRTEKRGGGTPNLSLDEALVVSDQRADMFLALDMALEELSEMDERLASVVEYRFFGGMTEEEIAELMGVSVRTIRRDWQKAKIWLADTLTPSD